MLPMLHFSGPDLAAKPMVEVATPAAGVVTSRISCSAGERGRDRWLRGGSGCEGMLSNRNGIEPKSRLWAFKLQIG